MLKPYNCVNLLSTEKMTKCDKYILTSSIYLFNFFINGGNSMIKFEIKNKWSGKLQFTAEINCKEDQNINVKLGLAVLWGIKKSANLHGADLRDANLRDTNLHGANLRDADLRDADLRDADLHGANLHGADLRDANLRDADLHGANLRDANLRDTNLHGTDLRDANLHGAEFLNYSNCPEEGSFIAFKKLRENLTVKLEIPEEAKRTSSIVGRKCRAEYVKIIAIYNEKEKEISEGVSQHDEDYIYKVGEIIKSDKYDDDPRIECTNGIHFFISKKEAEEY